MDIEWVIYHLIHNDDENFTSIVDLDIDLCRSDLDQWDRLLTGLSRNRTVTSIELSRGYQSLVVTEDDLQRIFSALRHLPRLSKVKLDSFTTFDLEQTKSLFDNNDTIEEIWIENAQCHYDDEEDNLDEKDDYEDYNRYNRFLGYLASMSRNRLRRLRIEIPEKLSHSANLASLLSGSSKLESLVIETTNVMSTTAPFMLRGAPYEEDRRRKFAAAMAALQSNLFLKMLDMDFHISFQDFKDVATMLKHNKTLTDLCIRLDTSPEMIHGVSNDINHGHDYHPHFIESIQLFFEALKTNTNSALKFFSQYNFDDCGLRSAVLAHRGAPLILSTMLMPCTERAQSLIEIGLDMLHYNHSLEYFSFFLFGHSNSNLGKKKQMFLRLNERGRRSVQHGDIRETVPKSSWVDQLSKHSMDDLDGLYYYISTNPSICRTIKEDVTRSTLSKIHKVAVIDENNKKTNREKASAKEGRLEKSGEHLCSSRFDNNVLIKDSRTKRQRVDGISHN
jgi:hypothetical protein